MVVGGKAVGDGGGIATVEKDRGGGGRRNVEKRG